MNNKLYETIKYKAKPIEVALLLKNIFRIKRFNHKVNEQVFHIDPVSDFGIRLIKDNFYEPAMTEAILSHLDPGDIFIDLGANEGFFSVLASEKVGYTGRVLSIELQERLWPVLVKNFAQNDCTNCHLVPFAIGNETGEIEVTLSPSLNSGQSSIIEGQSFLGSREIAKKIRSLYWKTQKVRVKKLEDIWPMYNLSQVKLIKIDIEGYEFEALRSARKVLEARKIKHILIEFHPVQLSQLNQSKEQITTYLSELGYRQSTQTEDLFSLVNGEE